LPSPKTKEVKSFNNYTVIFIENPVVLMTLGLLVFSDLNFHPFNVWYFAVSMRDIASCLKGVVAAWGQMVPAKSIIEVVDLQ
jgi:hypothetical protein